jgi:vWA found in TerF C terminus
MPRNFFKRAPRQEVPSAAVDHVASDSSSAVDPRKVAAAAPGLVSLYKQAEVSLVKHQLTGERAAVYLVLDRSASMEEYYRDGSVQRLTEQTLGLAAHFDDDGKVPVVFFSSGVDGIAEVGLDDYQGRIDTISGSLGLMGSTNYAAAMRAVIKHYQRSGATAPGYVVFQTDGAPDSRSEATRTLCKAAKLPLFWQFVGFGSGGFDYLRELDELSVPEKRVVDNAGFFAAGRTPGAMPDAVLYDRLMGEFPLWLRAARGLGIVRG